MNIYSLYSKTLKRYNLPFFAEDDGAAVERISKMVTAQADPSLICGLDDLQLYCLGSFEPDNLDEPIVGACEAIFVLDNLHKELPLPPMIKSSIDKFFGGRSNG